MAKRKSNLVKVDRHQMYNLAALATGAEATKAIIDPDSEHNGGYDVAIKPKDQNRAGVQANGYIYYHMDKDGNFTMTDKEKESR